MKTYLVGGAVRDLIMGLDPKDRDYVVVGSTPEEMLAKGFKQVGADFPVFLDDAGTEYALARTEQKSGRGYTGFTVKFGPEVALTDDLARRDLTINAIAMNEHGEHIDPFNGQRDIQNKVLRHVSGAFADDPVRVLRLARFHARYGPEWTIDDNTKDFCKSMVQNGELNFLTRERVLKEFEKALSEDHTGLFFQFLHEIGAMQVCFPEIVWPDEVMALAVRDAVAPRMKFAQIAITSGRAEELETRLNLPVDWRKYRAMLQSLVEHSDMSDIASALRDMGAFQNPDLFTDLSTDIFHAQPMMGMLLKVAFSMTHKIGFDDLTDEQKATLKGPEIGKAIHELRREAVK